MGNKNPVHAISSANMIIIKLMICLHAKWPDANLDFVSVPKAKRLLKATMTGTNVLTHSKTHF